MATLAGSNIKDTYQRILQAPNADGINATPTAVQDGEGTASPLLIGTSAVQVSSTPSAPNDIIRLTDLGAATFDASQIASGTLPEARMPAGYLNATSIHGRAITANPPSNNQIYVYSTGTGQWELQTLGANLSGDVTGTTSSNTVVRLQGRDVDSSAPSSGQLLGWDGAQWTPTAPAAGGVENLKLADGASIDGTLRAIQDDNVSPNSAALWLALSQVRVRPAVNGVATFAVQQAIGTDVLVVDTTNAEVILAALQVSSLTAGVLQSDASGNVSSAALTNSELPVIDDTVHGDRGGGTLHAAATSGANGFMPAADKAKIDLYPAIATLTTGHVLRATGAGSVAFGAIQKADLPTLTAADVSAAAATHASTHATAGSDPLTPADIGAALDTDATIDSSATNTVPITVRGTAGQTAAVAEFYDAPAGNKIAQLLADGTLEILRVKVVEVFS